MVSDKREIRTGGREATNAVIPGRFALSVGKPDWETPPGWSWTRLTDVARLETGHTPSRKHPEYWNGDVPWVGIKDATNNHGTVIRDTYQHATQLGIDNSSARVLPANTVCLSRTASVGYVVIMGQPMATSQDFVNWVCSDKLDYRYLASILVAESSSFALFSRGTTHQTIYFPEVKAFNVLLPPITEQKRIANVIWALNDKVQLNHQTNQTLEQMAQAIFKSWFVDFEPVKAKIAALVAGGSEEDALLAAMRVIAGDAQGCANAAGGRMPGAAKGEAELTRLQAEQPEQYAELRATAELFPSAMQDSELGEIPEGWPLTTLDRHIELAYGKALKKDARIEGQYRVYGSGGVTGSHNEFLVPGPGIIVGRKGTVGSIYWEPDNFYPIDTTFYVTVKNGYSLAFAYYLLQTLGLSNMNTDAAVPGLNRNNVYRLEVPSFPEAIVDKFSKVVASISEKISISNAESRTLTELRDSLLPKLLSGELSISDAKDQLAENAEPADV